MSESAVGKGGQDGKLGRRWKLEFVTETLGNLNLLLSNSSRMNIYLLGSEYKKTLWVLRIPITLLCTDSTVYLETFSVVKG